MTTQAKKPTHQKLINQDAVIKTGKPPYPFRTIVGLILLAGNFLVAAIYFHILNP
ncbi:MAG: photosystem I protein PsaX [Leptolyngbyaceae bacterium]|nr:photosystem I protein PsaX [Leptolyngbyaceae bacterium]